MTSVKMLPILDQNQLFVLRFLRSLVNDLIPVIHRHHHQLILGQVSLKKGYLVQAARSFGDARQTMQFLCQCTLHGTTLTR